MSSDIFLAGATGVVGRRLIPMLRRAGYSVAGTTRSAAKREFIERLGATPVVVDAFDAAALTDAVTRSQARVLIDQLTDLDTNPGAPGFEASLARNARLRIETTPHVMAAATAAGIMRVIAQSVAFIYAAGDGPRREDDRLDESAVRTGASALEDAVLAAPGIAGIVLRYGYLYGPDTWFAQPSRPPAVHVDAAAHAALLAVTRGAPGIYNIADDDGAVSIEKARRELGFDPGTRQVD
jgi:nucleoside-diphosphate-sugar epimerase